IVLDGSYFSSGLVLHGPSGSHNPYDAHNSALAVNFNTLCVRIDERGGIASAEPQTPLTAYARKLAEKSIQRGEARLNAAPTQKAGMLYAGHLIKAFLEKAGIEVAGKVIAGHPASTNGTLLYRHHSREALAGLVKLVFEYSNNFMANQIFLVLGAERFGPPADAAKSRSAVSEYLSSLDLVNIHIEEGSGLSRRTRITARQMTTALNHFRPYRFLLNSSKGVWFKTGSLDGVKTLAGYIERKDAEPLTFVIMLQGRKYHANDCTLILDALKENLN
ncbi:MAG: D-alanyl-D-alanine carboxypeptidase, partial [Deltaproteobacteria bacterium]|nr:D-alanyl-D-alanine carboxypeptidase [Deltaproteobacteria bacterium]